MPDVAAFIDRYYNPARLDREPGRRERLIGHAQEDLDRHGSTLISRHESVTGEAVWLYHDGRIEGGFASEGVRRG
jgi:hypothetical protein